MSGKIDHGKRLKEFQELSRGGGGFKTGGSACNDAGFFGLLPRRKEHVEHIKKEKEPRLRHKRIRVLVLTNQSPLCPRVKAARGEYVPVSVSPNATIGQLKVAIRALMERSPSKALSLAPQRQRISISDNDDDAEGSSTLDDFVTLSSAGIVDGSVVRLKLIALPKPDVGLPVEWDANTTSANSLSGYTKYHVYPERKYRLAKTERLIHKHGGFPELKDSFANEETQALDQWVQNECDQIVITDELDTR